MEEEADIDSLVPSGLMMTSDYSGILQAHSPRDILRNQEKVVIMDPDKVIINCVQTCGSFAGP